MTQTELDRAVARATGESVQRISKLGFTVANPLFVRFDPEPYDMAPSVVDWDELQAHRHVALFRQRPGRSGFAGAGR